MPLYSKLASPSALGAATALGAGFTAFLLCLIFELVVPATTGFVGNYLGEKNLNLRSIILYATAGGVHLVLCTGGIVFFLQQLRTSESKLEMKRILVGILISFSVISSIILIACYFDINIVRHSYLERMKPLQTDARLYFLLATTTIPFVNFEIHPFAFFPLLLVIFGIAVAVTACFWISHKAIRFADRADGLKKAEIIELKRSVGQLLAITSTIFTTSTIATIAVMQIGRDWIEKGSVRDAYVQNGYAMSIFWSACYTSVTVLIVLIPLYWIAGYTKRIQRQAKYSGGRAGFFDQIYEVVSFKAVSQAAAATLVPLFTSTMAALFGT
ncbi:hypothetical protein [Bradyrhizobium sp.]|jgi:hypothetical protein|uniref:hypothetical protein n=1 Tax=Bradyrhizobium sp. TaxID=376 RepID=UPI002E0615AC|nr:hypothetical protein [Bradyrhizobium sp.]